MHILILWSGALKESVAELSCFTDVVAYYLTAELKKYVHVSILIVPTEIDSLKNVLLNYSFDQYDAIVALGLRYFSKVPPEILSIIRNRFSGLVCQFYDGTRLDTDGVDITFTIKDDSKRVCANNSWAQRHCKFNEYVGWAADPDILVPNQSSDVFTIVVDHPNYGDLPLEDYSNEIFKSIFQFERSDIWKKHFKKVAIKQLISGGVKNINTETDIELTYNKSKAVSFAKLVPEYSSAHVFCVTHPESVGLVALEAAIAGALVITPSSCIPADRLSTIRHYEFNNLINWNKVLELVDPQESRRVGMKNNWESVAQRVIAAIEKRALCG